MSSFFSDLGWKVTEGVATGIFRGVGRHGFWEIEGLIQQDCQVLLRDLPVGFDESDDPKRYCITSWKSGWFKIHWATEPKDQQAAYQYVMQMLESIMGSSSGVNFNLGVGEKTGAPEILALGHILITGTPQQRLEIAKYVAFVVLTTTRLELWQFGVNFGFRSRRVTPCLHPGLAPQLLSKATGVIFFQGQIGRYYAKALGPAMQRQSVFVIAMAPHEPSVGIEFPTILRLAKDGVLEVVE